jgi:hypothetical protein
MLTDRVAQIGDRKQNFHLPAVLLGGERGFGISGPALLRFLRTQLAPLPR